MRRRLPDATTLAVVVVGVAIAFASRLPSLPAFLPIGNYPEYRAATPLAEVVLAPVMHAPWFGRVALPVALALSLVVLAGLWLAARRLSATAGAAATIVFAAAVRPEFATSLAVGAAPVLAIAWTWMAVAAASRPSWPTAAIAAVAAVAGALTWPPALALMPLVIAAAVAGRSWRAVALLVVAAPAGLLAGAAAWAARAGAMAGERVTVQDVLAVARITPTGDGPYPWPPLTAMAFPLALAVAGAVVVTWRRTGGRAAWALGAVVTTGVAVALTAWHPELQRAVAWSLWPLAAVGLTWLVERVSPPRRGVALAAFAVVLIGSGWLGRVRQTELVEPRAFAAALEQAVTAEGAGLTVVAEDPRVDTALVAWGGASLRRVRPSADRVEASATAGGVVIAGPAARAALELWGVRFTAGPSVWAPVPFGYGRVARGFHCVEVGRRWSELPGLDYTGRLGAHVPAGVGQLEVVVVGPDPVGLLVTSADGRPRGSVTTSAVQDLAGLPPVLWPGDGRLPADGTALAHARVAADAQAPVDVAIALGERAPLVGARMVDGGVATICAAPLPRPDPFERLTAGDRWRVPLDDAAFAGAGWQPLLRGRTSDARTADRRGVILVPSSRARTVDLAVDIALGEASIGAVRRAVVSINGAAVASGDVTASGATLEAIVPSALWLDGTNEIALTLAPPPGAANVEATRLVVRNVRLAGS